LNALGYHSPAVGYLLLLRERHDSTRDRISPRVRDLRIAPDRLALLRVAWEPGNA
jgi:hypothetical protein